MSEQTPVLVAVPDEAGKPLPRGLRRDEPAAASVSVEWTISAASD